MLLFLSRCRKGIARFFIAVIYFQLLFSGLSVSAKPVYHGSIYAVPGIGFGFGEPKPAPPLGKGNMAKGVTPRSSPVRARSGPGPTQPEMQGFSSVNASNMVDLFSGNFSYNIPLLDVGGYPVNISYQSGISMDQEASWVGLGWSVNPGTITRNMRGVPDDFDGADSIRKVASIKENKTIGVTGGADIELVGFPLTLGASLGIFDNNYKGWGLENAVNANINAGIGSSGSMTGGLSITNNSQNGLTIAPSLGVSFTTHDADDNAGLTGSFSVSAPYNSRTGLKGLQLTAGLRQNVVAYNTSNDFGEITSHHYSSVSTQFSSMIAFSSPTVVPTITMPYTSSQYSFTGKVGTVANALHPSFFLSGYVSRQKIATADTALSLPVFGYLYSQDATQGQSVLLDYNREKEIIYRDDPPVPNIAVPFYTYDAFSITGEGTGGMFRAYRGDVGYVHDHFIRTKDGSAGGSIDIGGGDLFHGGVDVNLSRSFTQNDAWLDQNYMKDVVAFRKPDTTYEPVYFRNPGEKSINSKAFYNTMGGDDVVTVALSQPGISSSSIQATNVLTRYSNKKISGTSVLTPANAVKPVRDKRGQSISYLTAAQADGAGLSKYIENHTPNRFALNNCFSNLNVAQGPNGLVTDYFPNNGLSGGPAYSTTTGNIQYNWGNGGPTIPGGSFPTDQFSIRWTGRIQAPVTGVYTFYETRDNGCRIWLNDSLILNQWADNGVKTESVSVNLVAGQLYKFRMEFVEYKGAAQITLSWAYPGQAETVVPSSAFFLPQADVIMVNSNLKLERRVTTYRKPNHLSEIDVLNPDGRRYVYGIPVYNFRQKEATFSVDGLNKGNKTTGLVGYTNGVDNTTNNQQGQDNYYSSQEIPSYAHSFLLTGILSPDYVDLTGNGISDDDLGDAVKFNYSKTNGIDHPFKWRAPYVGDSVTYNEGLKTDYRDDKGSYTYGEKEVWYLHSIESKTMVATFVTESRLDQLAIDEAGHKINDSSAVRLKEIDLYSKSDLLKNPATAKPIKTVHFDYTYELCPGINKPVTDSGKLTLKRIWFTYNGNAKIRQNPYVFNYNSNNPSYDLRSYDRWGNYKNPLQNPGSSTTNLITNADYPYALQDSTMAAANAAAWTLDSVYLPSGGGIKVTYESDDYAYVQNRRSMQLFKIAGFGSSSAVASPAAKLYSGSTENLYVYVNVPVAVTSAQDIYQKYLSGVGKLFFRLFVQMPTDQFGKGSEYVSCYADLDPGNGYGVVAGNPNMIWIKVSGIDSKGHKPGSLSPMAEAAIQMLRLNLPSKAYPGSQTGQNLDLASAIEMIYSMADNIVTAFTSYSSTARSRGWAQMIDTSRSFIRLDNPGFAKYGGGSRVKRIVVSDNWNKMAGGRTAVYGQDYIYKTTSPDGSGASISSGVASWEPGIGGEENPFRVPIEYTEETSVLGPTAMTYTEEPLGESLFPSPMVGYSDVRVRTINYKNTRSANGWSESKYYTAYDFPVFTDRTVLDGDTKKRFKPALANFLKIDAKYYLAMSQGFKIELNDMHGKLRSQATYAENDPANPVTYTENIYKVDNPLADAKRLSNVVMAMSPDGTIDSTALIGKDVEIMMDMREQQTITSSASVSLNVDVFAIPFIPPFMVLPSFFGMPQRQETKFQSVATTKVIQRYGIIDSVIHIDKGSKITTKDMLYDAETGEVLLNRTQNEFNDPVYSFSYPAYWSYDGMGMAYRNIGAISNHLNFSKGKASGLKVPEGDLFSVGDELLVTGKQFTGTAGACSPYATFGGSTKLWAFDSAIAGVGPSHFYFLDAQGNPYTGADVNVRVTRSGRKNLGGSIGSVTMLANPLVRNASNQYQISMGAASKVITAAATEYKNNWKIEPRNGSGMKTQIVCPSSPCYDTIPATYQDTSLYLCWSPSKFSSYTDDGAFIFNSIGSSDSTEIMVDNGFWENPGNTTQGRLNETGIWICGGCTSSSSCAPGQNWLGFNQQIYMPVSDTVFIGMGGDNQVRVIVDGTTTIQVLQRTGSGDAEPFYRWRIYPLYLTQGYHTLKIQGWNVDASSPASFGVEVYHMTRSALLTADSVTVKDSTLFSTSSVGGGQTFVKGYSCPVGYTKDSTGGTYRCLKPIACNCDTVLANYCYNAITDTVINPFANNILANWKPTRSYVYYTNRQETDPTAGIDTRTNGTIPNFAAFWQLTAGKWSPTYDTSRWVWNTQSTLFNNKGFELENKDALGVYRCGLYGYGNTLPTAEAQNAQYRETAYEGFEDYGYSTAGCDTTCPSARHFDFSNYAYKITTAQKHTGKSSLQLNAGDQAGLTVKLATVAQDTSAGVLTVQTATDVCTSQTYVRGIRANAANIIPLFSPFASRQMVLSAWVKEAQDCSVQSYTNDAITLVINGGTPTTLNFAPAGPIVEGWQRYESIFTLPANDTSMTVNLRSTGSYTVYFDDLRIHPFNADMKSFVYHPVNLRLMAELDENNWATFYEYDDDGTLVRVKKETERGIQTIKETRTALYKQ